MLKLRPAPERYDERFMDTMASAYLERTPWTELRLAVVRDLVDPHPGDRVLDLGCAAGAITHYLSTLGADPVGIDSEPLAIEKAQELFPELRFEVADACDLPFPDARFDKAVAADFVEHIEDGVFERMCVELRRVLTPGGTFALYTPNPRHLVERLKAHEILLAQNPTHIGLRDAPALESLLGGCGFEVVRSEWRPSFFPGLRTVEKVVGRRHDVFRYRLCVLARVR
ncbi:MAG: class I SAM-dependent methyltransferase [Verrucomicrobiota bacterium]